MLMICDCIWSSIGRSIAPNGVLITSRGRPVM
jgi:hypothetical protein